MSFRKITVPKRNKLGYIDVQGLIQFLEHSGYNKCDVVTKDGIEKLLVRDTEQIDVKHVYSILFRGAVLNLVDRSWRMIKQTSGSKTGFNKLMLDSLSPEFFKKPIWERTGYNLREINGRFVDGIYLSGIPEYIQIEIDPSPIVDPRQKNDWATTEYYLQGYVELERNAFELAKRDLDEKNFGDATKKLTKADYASTEIKEGDEISYSFHDSTWTIATVLETGGFGEGQQKQNYIKIHKRKTNEQNEKELLDWSWEEDKLLKELPFRLLFRYPRNPKVGGRKRKIDDAIYLRDLLSKCKQNGSRYQVISTEFEDNTIVNTQVGNLTITQEALNSVRPELRILNLGKVASELIENYTVELYKTPNFFQVEIK